MCYDSVRNSMKKGTSRFSAFKFAAGAGLTAALGVLASRIRQHADIEADLKAGKDDLDSARAALKHFEDTHDTAAANTGRVEDERRTVPSPIS